MSELGSDGLDPTRRMGRRGVFGGDAERYDRVRPGYPAALFDAVEDRARLQPGSRVLEIGPGTGQATVAMLDRGWAVQAVELDPAMAAVARRRTGGRAEVVVGDFETEPSPRPAVDLVLAATSFHWLDPATRRECVAHALRRGGTVAIIWSRHVRGGTQAFFDSAQSCYERFRGGEPATMLLDETEVTPRTAEFEESSLFEDAASTRFPIEIEYRTDGYLDLLQTYSETIALAEGDRIGLLECIRRSIDERFGGRIVKRYVFDLVLATRV